MNPLLSSLFFFTVLIHASDGVQCDVGDTKLFEKCYQFNSNRLSLHEANLYCLNQGKSLTKIENRNVANFLSSIAQTKFGLTYGNFWIGLHKTDTGFKWFDGDSVSWQNWAPGFPFSGYSYVGAQVSNTKWSSILESTRLPFICGYETSPDRTTSTTTVSHKVSTNNCYSADLFLGNRCYFFINSAVSRLDAEQICANKQTTLAIFDDITQLHFISAEAQLYFERTYETFWIGLHRPNNNSTFIWDDGRQNTQINGNWNYGFPYEDEQYVSQYFSNSYWKTNVGTEKLNFICSGIVNN